MTAAAAPLRFGFQPAVHGDQAKDQFLSVYVPGTVLGTGDSGMNQGHVPLSGFAINKSEGRQISKPSRGEDGLGTLRSLRSLEAEASTVQ